MQFKVNGIKISFLLKKIDNPISVQILFKFIIEVCQKFSELLIFEIYLRTNEGLRNFAKVTHLSNTNSVPYVALHSVNKICKV